MGEYGKANSVLPVTITEGATTPETLRYLYYSITTLWKVTVFILSTDGKSERLFELLVNISGSQDRGGTVQDKFLHRYVDPF